MDGRDLFLLLVFAAGALGRNGLITAAAAILLVLRLFGMDSVVRLAAGRGIQAGLVILLVAVLAPFALKDVELGGLGRTLGTRSGILAILAGAVATHINWRGLALLQTNPEVIVGLMLGSLIGVALLRGIPVGPLMAAGIAAILYGVFGVGR